MVALGGTVDSVQLHVPAPTEVAWVTWAELSLKSRRTPRLEQLPVVLAVERERVGA